MSNQTQTIIVLAENVCCDTFLFLSGKLGALRLKVRLVEDQILPSMYYQPLIDLLVESVISPTEVSMTAPLQCWYSFVDHSVTRHVKGLLYALLLPSAVRPHLLHLSGFPVAPKFLTRDPSSLLLNRWRIAALWLCWRRSPQLRADRTWQWLWWKSTWDKDWWYPSWTTLTPGRSTTPVRRSEKVQTLNRF